MTLIQRDEYTLILQHCDMVTYHNFEYVVHGLGNVDVSIHSDTSGKGGFIVVFTLLPDVRWYCSATFVQYVATILLVNVLLSA